MTVETGTRCECGKVSHPSKKDAKREYRWIKSKTGKSAPVSFYECRWGSWHWTHQNRRSA